MNAVASSSSSQPVRPATNGVTHTSTESTLNTDANVGATTSNGFVFPETTKPDDDSEAVASTSKSNGDMWVFSPVSPSYTQLTH